VERITDRGAVRLDMLYTAIHRLGVFRLGLFFLFDPLWDSVAAQMRLAGLPRWQLDAALAPLWPGVTDTAVFALAAYLLLFDFADYWIHRGQHGLRWWWGLHALHHAQRQMTMWSDNRNHLLDALLRDSVLVLLASGIGIAPGQFIAVVVCTQLLESLSHANVRMHFGSLGDRLLVSPRFHREHHSIHFGEPGRNAASVRASGLGGRNFAILFPVWDLVFRTGCWADRYDATGVHDQLPGLGGRDYGRGFWSQQWLGLRRMMGRA
jgi:sterol desaturase/sphingolipid hydroxylase (fatty acid hydroxylase superfamily)